MTKEELEKALKSEEAYNKELRMQNAKLTEQLNEQADRLCAATAPLRRDTYSAAVKAYGKQSQLIMAMEEMAELTKELSKNIRGAKNTTAISEEIADVEIMLEQLKVIFGNRSEVDWLRSEKLDRLVVRLTDELA